LLDARATHHRCLAASLLVALTLPLLRLLLPLSRLDIVIGLMREATGAAGRSTIINIGVRIVPPSGPQCTLAEARRAVARRGASNGGCGGSCGPSDGVVVVMIVMVVMVVKNAVVRVVAMMVLMVLVLTVMLEMITVVVVAMVVAWLL
jgi:hypothetical protein